MIRRSAALVATLSAALALSACSSARLGGNFGGPVRQAQAAPAPAPVLEPEPVEAVPSGGVTAAPLPPVDGTVAVPGPVVAPGTTDIAALPPAAAPAPQPTPALTGRSSLVGGWTARDAAGGSCRVQLSSAPSLDLYRASTSGCGNQDLAKVNAWDYRDGELYLYQSGGTVAARLRTGGGALSGVIARSGAPLTLAR